MSCLCGVDSRSLNYLMDYLVAKAVTNLKYFEVNMLILERKKYSTIPSVFSNSTTSKFKYFRCDNIFKTAHDQNVSTISDMFDNLCQIKSVSQANLSSTIVFVYSISEVILTSGEDYGINLLRNIIKLGAGSIVVSVNKSLHSSYVVSQIQDLCNVIVNISLLERDMFSTRTNISGLQIIGECITIRRSKNTGKITEQSEFLSSSVNADGTYSISPYITQSKHYATNAIEESKQRILPNVSDSGVVLSIASNTSSTTSFVVFDKTDPEFEDDNLDDDLDL